MRREGHYGLRRLVQSSTGAGSPAGRVCSAGVGAGSGRQGASLQSALSVSLGVTLQRQPSEDVQQGSNPRRPDVRKRTGGG